MTVGYVHLIMSKLRMYNLLHTFHKGESFYKKLICENLKA